MKGSAMGLEYETDDDRRGREEGEAEDRAMEADPYSDDEKDQMGSQVAARVKVVVASFMQSSAA